MCDRKVCFRGVLHGRVCGVWVDMACVVWWFPWWGCVQLICCVCVDIVCVFCILLDGMFCQCGILSVWCLWIYALGGCGQRRCVCDVFHMCFGVHFIVCFWVCMVLLFVVYG